MVPAKDRAAPGLLTDFELMVLLATLTVGEGAHDALWAGLPELKHEPPVGELVGEYSARRSQVWLWYWATRVQAQTIME